MANEIMQGFTLHYASSEKEKFWLLLDQLKANQPTFSPLYSRPLLNYFKEKAIYDGYLTKELSWIMCLDGLPISVFFGAELVQGKKRFLKCYDLPCLAVDVANITSKAKKRIHTICSELLNQPYSDFWITYLPNISRIPTLCDYLITKSNCQCDLETNRMIDLKLTEPELKTNLRKSYHSLINWGLREMSIEIYNQSNITWEIMDSFRRLHIREAGRETRSVETWERQYESVRQGSAFCITSFLENEIVSAGWFQMSDRYCHYGSSASRRDFFSKPIFHALLWKAILYAKENDCLLFGTGSDFTEINKSQNISNKEMQIAKFKEGFGGRLYLNLVLRKSM